MAQCISAKRFWTDFDEMLVLFFLKEQLRKFLLSDMSAVILVKPACTLVTTTAVLESGTSSSALPGTRF
jgi:hypothetical protein